MMMRASKAHQLLIKFKPVVRNTVFFALWSVALIGLVVFNPLQASMAQNLTITEPLDGSCIAGEYTVDSPLVGGIINGNNFAPDPANMSFRLDDNSGNSLNIEITTSTVSPAFAQPAPPLCPDGTTEACGGQGFCIFTGECICFDNNDCDNGNGVCNAAGFCGCANDQQCGAGQVCNQGECACANNDACAVGESCLPSGACSCTTTDDCGGDLICSNGICSNIDQGDTSFDFVDQASPEDLPRVIERTVQLPPSLEDSESLAVSIKVYDYSLPPPSLVATQSVGFKLDRAFPLLSTTDNCSDDSECSNGELCDQVTSRCFPANEANIGNCRELEDFSQGISADYALTDNFDENPSLTVLEIVEDGCLRSQQFLLADDCGNAQIVSAEGVRAPTFEEINVELEAYLCNSSPCARETSIVDGATASRINVTSVVTAPNRCYDYVSTVLDRLDENGNVLDTRPLFDDEILEAMPANLLSSRELESSNGSVSIVHGGPFQLVEGQELIFNLHNNASETFVINAEDYFDLNAASASEVLIAMNRQVSQVFAALDGTDLRIKTRDFGSDVSLDIAGSAAESLGFTAAFDSASAVGSGDGVFRARSELYACGNDVALLTDNFNFTVSMPFDVSIGGPYSVAEGETLDISAANIFVSNEFGGIARVEWDVDGDGVYEREELFDPPVTELPSEPQGDPDTAEQMLTSVSVDTDEQQNQIVSIRITTGQDESLEARASVEITDISPTCVLPQAVYDVREGEAFVFTAPDTRSTNDADPISEYQWNFGDGSDSFNTAENNIQYIYDNEGEYTLTLNALDEDSACPEAATALVRVGGVAPIIEGVGLDPDSIAQIEGEAITFTSGQTRAGAASDPIVEYIWDFGYLVDGQPVREVGEDLTAPVHTFENDGDYNVCLTVRDSDDQVGPNCFNVTVEDLNPSAIWNANTLQANEGEAITFDWSGTVAGGVADPLSSLTWDFGDGSAPVPSDLDTPTIDHIFNGDGPFTVRITANDEDSSSFYEAQVNILDVSPNAIFDYILPEGATTPLEGVELTLDASASTAGAATDPIATYRWDFGDGSEPRETASPNVSHAWPDGPATYEVQCTVVDSDGSTAVSTLQLSVENVAPEVAIVSEGSSEVGSTSSFGVNVSDVTGDLPSTPGSNTLVEWDMGDGTTLTGAEITHVYNQEGTFNISVTFNDGDGGIAEASSRFTVNAQLAQYSSSVAVELARNGGLVEDPRLPIGEFSDLSSEDNVYYLREGDEITLEVIVTSAELANGVLNPASYNWIRVPENARITNQAITPAPGEPQEGSRVKSTTLSWRPGFFEAGTYELLFRVSGEFGGEFDQTWKFNVAERGTPMLATTSGSLRQGRVVIYRYDQVNGELSFAPNREVNVGQGAYDIIADRENNRLFVSSPLSGHVAVLGGSPIRLLRRIPTGAGAYDMDMGGGHLWVVNAEANTLSAIDPYTLKVRKTLNLVGIRRPLAVAYVSGESFSPRVVVGCALTGKIILINATDALAGNGEQAIEHEIALGGSLTQFVQKDDQLWVADSKLRKIYQASINTLVQTGNASSFSQIEGIPFAVSDMVANEQGLWVATGDDLSLIDADGFIEGYELSVDRLINADPMIYGNDQSVLIIADGLRLEHRLIDGNLDLIEDIGIESSRLQKLTNFVQYTE